MHPDKFGDSYDLVKRSFLRCLSEFGPWPVHPMFSQDFGQLFPRNYSEFLGLPLTTCRPVPSCKRDRAAYFRETTSCPSADQLFLDPDTGLTLRPDKASRQHLTAEELVDIAKSRRNSLVLVFDQSISRGKHEKVLAQVKNKLQHLEEQRVYGFAYISHANFILASAQEWPLQNAKLKLQRCLMIPSGRLVGPYS